MSDDEERWRLALDGLKEVSAQYQQLLKSVQSGFGSLSQDSAALHRRLALIETRVQALDATMQQLLPHIAAIAAYVVRMQAPPPTKRRDARRVNGE